MRRRCGADRLGARPRFDDLERRKKKTLVTDNPQGQAVKVLTFDTGLDEADRVVERMAADVKAGALPGHVEIRFKPRQIA